MINYSITYPFLECNYYRTEIFMAAKLRVEGLTVSKGGANKALYHVDNYEEHLFDFKGIHLQQEHEGHKVVYDRLLAYNIKRQHQNLVLPL